MSKKLFLPALLFIAGALFITSCGDDCKFNQDDFSGQYNTTEKCSNSVQASYNITVVAGASETEIKISNFWEFFSAPIVASIDCDAITIARQEPDGDDYFVEGTGLIEKNDGVTTITLTYTVTDESSSPIATDNCTQTVFTKL